MAQAELNAARLLLLYNLGNACVELRYRQTVLTLQDQEMPSRRQTLAMTQTMVEARRHKAGHCAVVGQRR